MFVSIHLNSGAKEVTDPVTGKKTVVYNNNVRGFSVKYQAGDTRSQALAGSIAGTQTVIPLIGNGTGAQDLSVCRNFKSTGPVVLIEAGFVTNAQDVQAIKEQTSKIASQIAAGIMNYTGEQ